MLAAFYPGIPGDYPQWDEWTKRAWINNIGHAIAEIDYQRQIHRTDTPEGIYNAVLAKTGDKELADKVAIDIKLKAKLAAVAANPNAK